MACVAMLWKCLAADASARTGDVPHARSPVHLYKDQRQRRMECSSAGTNLNYECRYSKNDGQLVKTLEQLLEGVVDYFVWASKHSPALEMKELCFQRFLTFVDSMVMYFTGCGLPTQIAQAVIKVLKLQPVEVRTRVCESHQWQAHSMQGSASMWISAAPALRAALESKGAEPEEGGRRKRARVAA
jgi:hypothetical protein